MAVTLPDMSMLHRVFRREFARLPNLIRAVTPGDSGRAGVLAAAHLDHEEAVVCPLADRVITQAAPADPEYVRHVRGV